MAVEVETGRLRSEADEPGWEVDPDDEWGIAVIATVGRQLKLRREAVGMRAAEFGAAVGYGEDLVYKVEGGKRIPRQEYLDRADEVLGAGGLIAATWEDVKKVRYPKKVRELGKLEAKAVEIGLYECHIIAGLLQTPEHARSLIEAAQPPYSADDVERMVAARLARQSVFERDPAPSTLRARRGAAATTYRGDNGLAAAARTTAGGGPFEQRHASGDAVAQRDPLRHGRQDRTAEVRGRYRGGPLRRCLQRPPDVRSQATAHP
ncbi:hypothetical protein GCM10010377_39730 [Streptomyces viridiviolaceus]|nr:hypothetical protein GCM10010377_39730 [Streptomyces viridiviolaceus]